MARSSSTTMVPHPVFSIYSTVLLAYGHDKKSIIFHFHRDIEDRYVYLREVAQTRAILSLGISCFKLKKPKSKEKESEIKLRIKVHVYNIVVLCAENYLVEPESLKFLVEHGFDFNKQYGQGVPYTKGCDEVGMSKQPFFTTCYTTSR